MALTKEGKAHIEEAMKRGRLALNDAVALACELVCDGDEDLRWRTWAADFLADRCGMPKRAEVETELHVLTGDDVAAALDEAKRIREQAVVAPGYANGNGSGPH